MNTYKITFEGATIEESFYAQSFDDAEKLLKELNQELNKWYIEIY